MGPETQIGQRRSWEELTQHLVELATKGLPVMFDQSRRLFCHSLKKTDQGMARVGISRRYTIITLMGLHRLEKGGVASPIETLPVLEGLLADLNWVDNIGDLGLLLWLCALMAPERLVEVARRLKIHQALARFPDARSGRTMELAWFLSGLAHWGLACPEKLDELRDLTFKVYGILSPNEGEGGFFSHLARNGSTTARIRGNIGSFADQVYPIYAMTKMGQAYRDGSVLHRALRCGLRLVNTQGPRGQWWWHYGASSGRIVEAYPVFSVHQHGMGPMTLFELGDATNYDFTPWIRKGLQWVSSLNELAFDMEDESAGMIWRCVFLPGMRRHWHAARLATGRHGHAREDVKVLFECRPYELGWLLYALAGRPACQRTMLLSPTTLSQSSLLGQSTYGS